MRFLENVRAAYTLPGEGGEDRHFIIDLRAIVGDRISGNAFLYNMVRIIAGTLAEIGLHRLEPDAFGRAFASLNRLDLGMTAPACGLELTEVRYPDAAFTDPASIRWHQPEED